MWKKYHPPEIGKQLNVNEITSTKMGKQLKVKQISSTKNGETTYRDREIMKFKYEQLTERNQYSVL